MSETSLARLDFAGQWLANRNNLVAVAKEITAVDSDSALEVAGTVQTDISKAIKTLENERLKVTRPLDAAKKLLTDEEKKLAAPLQDELARLKALTSAYATACAKRIEEERRAAELAERRAAEAALAAEDADPFGFNAPAPASVVAVPMPVSSMPKTSANRMVERWDFDILDANAVPRELCSPDEKKIRAFIASKKAEGYKADQVLVKGLKIFSTVQVQSR